MRKSVVFILTVLLVIGLFGCNSQQQQQQTTLPTEPEVTTVPEPTQADIYALASEALTNAAHKKLQVSSTQIVKVAEEEQHVVSEQTILMSGVGTTDLKVQVEEDLSVNDYDEHFQEYYTGGMLYIAVSGDSATDTFKGEVAQEDYADYLVPAVLLNAELYENVTLEEHENGSTVTFSEATAAEDWAVPEGAELISAEGTAKLDSTGALAESAYKAVYRYGSTEVEMTVTVIPTIDDAIAITAPENESDYVAVTDIAALKVYEQAFLHMLAANSVSGISTETLVFQAAGYMQTAANTVAYSGVGVNHVSSVEQTINTLYDSEMETYTITDTYQNGKCATVDSTGAEETIDLPADIMLSYCQETLSANFVSLEYIADMKAELLGGVLYIELSFNDTFAEQLRKSISQNLYADEAYMDSYTTEYTPIESTGYIAVDLCTGFPTAAGYLYQCGQVIEGDTYSLMLQADQTCYVGDLTAYETATGLKKTEPEPEEKAQPLFYHVTGNAGQEMWLLGTIHVGDERTAYLPQQIYNALESSDALAVEFDMQAYEEEVLNNEKLANQVALLYFYLDGSTMSDRLEPEVYDYALKLLKASGNYNMNMEIAKPYLWSQSIENFYIQQGYDLLSDKGVDNRLLTFAKARDMKIIDIESGMEQLKMLANFSEDLQIFLLENTLSGTHMEYYAAVEELYEAWCAGDEAVLRDMVSSDLDPEELTEEEKAELETYQELLDEYDKAMNFDRNEKMLAAAMEYLESDDVIFYAVGLAHLLDENNGLVDALRDAGYTVELVSYT